MNYTGVIMEEKIAVALDTKHTAWYVDFKNNTTHCIIFPNRIFTIDRTKKAEHDAATQSICILQDS